MKKKPIAWEEIFISYTHDRGLVSTIHKELTKVNIKTNPNNSIKNRSKETNREFSEDKMQMAKIYCKQCSTCLVIREMQIKITLRCHLTPVRMAKVQKKTK